MISGNRRNLVFIIFVLFIAASSSAAQLAKAESDWKLVTVLDCAQSPAGILRDAVALDVDSEKNIFIVDRARNRIIKLNADFIFIKEIGGFGNGPEQFSSPQDVWVHSKLNIFVADYNNDRIVRYDANLNYLNELSFLPDAQGYFEMPLSLAVSGQFDIFILEDLNKRIIKINRFDEVQTAFGDAAENLGQLLAPVQISLNREENIFVSDPAAKAVIVFDYLGNFLREITHPDLNSPKGIFTTADDDLLVVESESKQVFFFKNGAKLYNRFQFNLPEFRNIQLNDVAYLSGKGKETSRLLLLSSEKLFVFEMN